jgi:hypothetical protein
MPCRAASGGMARGFTVAPFGVPKEDFFLGGVAMRCRVPSTSATQEMVLKQKIAPGLKVILLFKMMAMELALIDDTSLPGALAIGVLCPTTHPGVPSWCFCVTLGF